jgi:hypothetical protein
MVLGLFGFMRTFVDVIFDLGNISSKVVQNQRTPLMRQQLPTITGLFCLLLLGSLACKKEPKIEQADLVGRWDVTKASRNGSPSEAMEGLFFEFFGDGKMLTNMSGVDMSATYKLKDKLLLQREGEMDVDYQIEKLSDSTLILNTHLRNFDFHFELKKKVLVN